MKLILIFLLCFYIRPVEESEKIKSRKELNQLAEDIPVYRTYLVQPSKDRKQRIVRLSRVRKLRMRACLMEQGKSIRKKATEKTDLKIQTDWELFQLNLSSGGASLNHQEASDSSLEKNEKKIIQKMKKKTVLKFKK